VFSPSPLPSPLSACGHAQAGIKGEGVFWTFYETVNFELRNKVGSMDKLVCPWMFNFEFVASRADKNGPMGASAPYKGYILSPSITLRTGLSKDTSKKED